jgi:hypothetical protein
LLRRSAAAPTLRVSPQSVTAMLREAEPIVAWRHRADTTA